MLRTEGFWGVYKKQEVYQGALMSNANHGSGSLGPTFDAESYKP